MSDPAGLTPVATASAGGLVTNTWNGSCVSLEGGEVTTHKPDKPVQAHIEWSWLGQGMKSALRKNAALNDAFQARQKECRGATSGAVSNATVPTPWSGT